MSNHPHLWRIFASLCALALAACVDLPDVAGSVAPTSGPLSQTTGGTTTRNNPPPSSTTQCGNGVCDPGESCTACPQDCHLPNGNACPRVGTVYSVWHLPAYTAMQQLQSSNQPQLTIEDVLRSRVATGTPPNGGPYTLAQVLPGNTVNVAEHYYYQHHPAVGFYCLYKARLPGDINYTASHEGSYQAGTNVPDCPMAANIADMHAQQLSAAGVDYVVADMSNFAAFDVEGDALALRPTEVLAQSWQILRQSQTLTPDITAWIRFPVTGQTLPTEGPMYTRVLAMYNDPQLAGMFMRDRRTGKKVLFYVDDGSFDPSLIAVVQKNQGANDILAVPLNNTAHNGDWAVQAACAEGVQLGGTCNQPGSPATLLGAQLPVTASFQSANVPQGWAGLPFGASGVYGGATLRMQFATALATQPNYVLLASWNEHVAQAQNPNDPNVSMGLETDTSANNISFFTNYGAEFSRDLEPTQEYQTQLYDVLNACIHVFKSGATSCDDPNNACCQGGNFAANFAFYNSDVSFGMVAPGVSSTTGLIALYACANNVVQDNPRCQGPGNGKLIGYGSSTKGGGMLRTLLECDVAGPVAIGQQPQDRISNSLSGACPAGQRTTFIAYVR